MALIVAVSAASALTLMRVRFPGGLIFGAMAASGILHGTGLVTAVLPWWIGGGAVIVLGAVVGSRFAGASPQTLLGYLGAAFGSFAVSLTIAGAFVLLVTYLFPFPVANVVVAFSPGAQDTMMVLALALHLDPVLWRAHVARFLVVTITVALAARQLAKKEK